MLQDKALGMGKDTTLPAQQESAASSQAVLEGAGSVRVEGTPEKSLKPALRGQRLP